MAFIASIAMTDIIGHTRHPALLSGVMRLTAGQLISSTTARHHSKNILINTNMVEAEGYF